MICLKCKTIQKIVTGNVEISNRPIGPFVVPNLTYLFCENCNKKSFPKDSIIAIEEMESKLRTEAIGSLPISDFLSGPQTIEILGMTKQGFQQNNRIQRGFIYLFEIGERKFYNKRSVFLFKDTGDGRFPLLPSIIPALLTYNNQVHCEASPSKYSVIPRISKVYPMDCKYEDSENAFDEMEG